MKLAKRRGMRDNHPRQKAVFFRILLNMFPYL